MFLIRLKRYISYLTLPILLILFLSYISYHTFISNAGLSKNLALKSQLLDKQKLKIYIMILVLLVRPLVNIEYTCMILPSQKANLKTLKEYIIQIVLIVDLLI